MKPVRKRKQKTCACCQGSDKTSLNEKKAKKKLSEVTTGIMDINSGVLSTTSVRLTPKSKGGLTLSAHPFQPKLQQVKANVPLAASVVNSDSKGDSKSGIMDIKSGVLSTTPVRLTPKSKGGLTLSAHTFQPKLQQVKANVPLAASFVDSDSKGDSKSDTTKPQTSHKKNWLDYNKEMVSAGGKRIKKKQEESADEEQAVAEGCREEPLSPMQPNLKRASADEMKIVREQVDRALACIEAARKAMGVDEEQQEESVASLPRFNPEESKKRCLSRASSDRFSTNAPFQPGNLSSKTSQTRNQGGKDNSNDEKTRIGKFINALRKKTKNEQLARRAKELVKSRRKLVPQTSQRVNGEETHNSIVSSPGGMTVLGPGPVPGNRTMKTYISVPGTQRYKTSSPSVMIERSSSPYFSSASNSPLLNSTVFQGSSLPSMPSNYAPVKLGTCPTSRTDANSVNKTLLNTSNQSKNLTSSQNFKPVSPSVLKQDIVTSSGTCILPSRTSLSTSPGLINNSNSTSPLLNTSVNVCSQNVSPVSAFSVTHSSLDLSKINTANKRLRKEKALTNCATTTELIASDSKTKIGDGLSDITENNLPSENSAFNSVTSCHSNSVDGDKTLTPARNPKRKRSFDNKNELQENRLGDMIASLHSGAKLPKLKTTQQLIDNLQAKKGFSTVLSSESLTSVDSLHSSEAEVSRTKSELLKKFLIASQSVRGESNRESPVDESSVSASDYGSHSAPDVSSVINTNLDVSSSILASRKEKALTNCATTTELIASDSNTKIGNGMSDITEKYFPSESSAFNSVTSCHSNSVDGDKTLTPARNPKRKRSFDNKNELQENRLGDMIASLHSGAKLPKVKTTQQLIADSQAKKGFSTVLSSESLTTVDSLHSSEAEVSRTKSELLKKFLIASQSVRGESNRESPVDESSVSASDYGSHSVPDVSSVINTNLDVSSSILASRKEKALTNCATTTELIASDSKTKIGNGMSDMTENNLPSESSAFNSVTSCHSNSVDGDKTLTPARNPKRKRSFDNKNELQENRLGDMIASLHSGAKLPKVKTTQQLIADSQAKKAFSTVLSSESLTSVDSLHSSEAEVSRTKSELLKKFLIASQSVRGESNRESPVEESSVSASDYGSHSVPDVSFVINTNLDVSSSISHPDSADEEVNKIPSVLRPISPAEINLNDSPPPPRRRTSVTNDDLNRLNDSREYVNGVYDCNGTFRPWQECTEQKSYLEESFQILPYVNID